MTQTYQSCKKLKFLKILYLIRRVNIFLLENRLNCIGTRNRSRTAPQISALPFRTHFQDFFPLIWIIYHHLYASPDSSICIRSPGYFPVDFISTRYHTCSSGDAEGSSLINYRPPLPWQVIHGSRGKNFGNSYYGYFFPISSSSSTSVPLAPGETWEFSSWLLLLRHFFFTSTLRGSLSR